MSEPSDLGDSPFHRGEWTVQSRVGVRERVERMGRRMIRGFMPEQHRELFSGLPFLVVGSVDSQGQPWASIVAGPPGFISSPDAETLRISAEPFTGDPLAAHLAAGAPVGLLGIELSSRRRNRANGSVTRISGGGFSVRIEQSFGNCPQYIQARNPRFVTPGAGAGSKVTPEGPLLSGSALDLIAHADTFFIASAAPAERAHTSVAGVDVSHRGGPPGFVQARDEASATVLTFPDYRGNFMFNTLGNLELEPRAGLLFVDFERGGLLSLAGEARVVWEGPELSAFAGAQRLVRYRVSQGVWMPDALALRWSRPEPAEELAALRR